MTISKLAFRAALISAVSAQGIMGWTANAQTASTATGVEDIIVTAQRQAQSLQDVPIAVSAFSAETLTEKQINNAQQLQLTLPNITFSKGNFTGSSFTIRGIGDLCVGGTCDSATGIATNDMPLFGTRIFETEYFDLERVEVLRGPQGTLFGRNATSGVVNFITAKPDASGFKASGEAGYGNFNEIRLQGMVNVPLTDTLAVRVAGFYLKRDGYTENLYDGNDLDNRDMYAIRGSLRWEPTDATTIDLMGYYFREDDKRLRIQKQLCQRDPTGVLGCLPGRLDYGVTNSNSTFVGTLSSKEFLTTQGGAGIGALGLGSLYGKDTYANAVNPSDPRKVNTDYTPSYFTDELQAMARIEHDFGSFRVKASGMYQRNEVDSSQDYNLSVQDPSGYAAGLATMAAYASGAFGPGLAQFGQVKKAVNPSAGVYCTSLPISNSGGTFSGDSLCAGTPLDFDRSRADTEAWTGELIFTSQFDGRFNFLLGGIYSKLESNDVDYYVNSFGIDYITGVLGTATALGQQATNPAFPNVFLATSYYRSNQEYYKLKTYGIFGEGYFDLTDTVKITAGLRYNSDSKSVRARTTLANFPTPYGIDNVFDSPFFGSFDADPGTPGNQAWQERSVSFDEFTGRFVIDWRASDDNLLYASYSRGYKSGGINPPLSPVFAVADAFEPEFVDAFEIGSKNRFLDGTLQLNLTGFYYKYKGLQLSRIVNRTSVNDNVDANIWGVEVEGVVRPIPPLAVNLGFSYLNTEVASDKYLANPRDPSGGRSDAVIIKDITNGANCTVVSNAGNAAIANGFVTNVNNAINAGAIPGLQAGAGLRAPTAFPNDSGINGATGAFSVCAALTALAANPAAGVSVIPVGVEQNIRGNQLPQAPEFKVSVGVQYTLEMDNGMSIVPRWDLAFTGQSYGNIFNGSINRVPAYEVMNAQIQLNGADNRWFVRGFVQNLTDNSAVTGLYVTDQSSGMFTNIFTLEPRRYGVVAGFNF
ncbi:TonB-dependent receptor [Sandaracinobacteroides hominis]|uniref:TonB-dependent receptor n=1 Tax=Sandaracinobacteroides hominis TaxID=2780086 RepID=UPI0018F6EC06|nr:TonB-dependent receptor [Sandaracinobacteroides hominis]